MDKSIKITLIIAATLIILTLIGVYTAFNLSPGTQSNVITANGMSQITATPDKVSLNFNVETKGADSKTANDKNAEIVDKLIKALIAEGFNKTDIQTTGYNVYEDFEWTQSGQKSLGYKATHNVVVKMSTAETSKIGNAIDAGINANATLSYINFELSQELENKYKADAIKLAAEDAKVKAQSMASGLGKSLGKLVSVTDSSFNYNPWRVYDYAAGATMSENAVMAKSAATNIQPSEQTISAQVSVSYKIN
jgi:uncharacterized protein YggE